MATYYKKIKGKNYDRKLIGMADASVQGKGDGRISLNDARKILRAVKDSSDYSDIEKNTMKYIRDHYAFTPEADQWFRGEIRSWAAARGSSPKAKKQASSSKQKKAAPADATRRRDKPALLPAPPEPAKHEEPAHPEGPSLLRRILQFILIVIILVLIFLLLIPGTREALKSRITRLITAPEQQREATDTKTPAVKQQSMTPETQPKEPAKPAEEGDYYTVQVKDDLISISEKVLGDYSRWIELYNANRDIIQSPTMIFPGQKLKLPAAKK